MHVKCQPQMTPDSDLQLSLEESQARGPEYYWQLRITGMMLIITDNRRSPHISGLIDTLMSGNQLSGMAARKTPRDLENNLHCYRVDANPSRARQDPYNKPVSYHVYVELQRCFLCAGWAVCRRGPSLPTAQIACEGSACSFSTSSARLPVDFVAFLDE